MRLMDKTVHGSGRVVAQCSMFSEADVEHLWARVDKSGGPDSCWLWTGPRRIKGHGLVTLSGRTISAHRATFMVSTGVALTPDVVVRHKCNNPPCCNPEHHELGSVLDNNQDRVAAGRSARGEANGQAKLTRVEVEQVRKDLGDGVPKKRLARTYKVSSTLIRLIAHRKVWA
jgi:hypothetical protein